MKATLTFDLPDQRHNYESANKGHLYRRVIEETLADLRARLKHDTNRSSEDTMLAYQDIQKLIFDGLEEYGLLGD